MSESKETMSSSPDQPSRTARLLEWVEDRFPIRVLTEWAIHKTVPAGSGSIWYYFGGIALFLFLVQVGTGILLMFYYKPSADTAYESIRFIQSKVPFGWLIRSIHSWSANLMIFSAFVHMFSAFFMRAYQKPRELTWVTGTMLLGLLLGFGFSGYLLPWNELSFFATKVGTDMMRLVPVVGTTLMHALRGGEEVTGDTLPRFFALHVGLIPLLLASVLGLHLLFVQVQGMHEPDAWTKQPEKRKTMPFFPHFVLRDLLVWVVLLNVVAALALFFPAEIGTKADPFASAPEGIRPEWYFMFTFQTLKFLPATIGPFEGELLGLVGFSLGGLLWVFVPWIDRGNHPRVTKLVRFAGIGIILFIVVMTVLGYVLK